MHAKTEETRDKAAIEKTAGKIRGRPFLSERRIQARVRELAAEISKDYEGKNPLVVGLLKGAFMFYADLTRHLQMPITIDFLIASSYVMASTTGKIKIHADIREQVRGRHVILVEDIVDTGITLNHLRQNILGRSPESLKICSLLDKKDRREVDVPIDYVGFTVPNEFLVGYGLDYDNRYRNLPYISVFKKSE
ncbi:MAG: hypoxanthine phosphoribosyltransferase [Nitrospirae bacterium]|jgi:hypoxanthine phosphoribosyltransferase|nr:hypoxanthine phosphoribosyltransferase [Nitrospirota bacterium]